MNNIFKVMASALAVAAAAAPGVAATDFTGAGYAIPDNNAAGAQSSVSVGNIGWVTSATISLNDWYHTWVGDLIVTLSHNGTDVAVLNRPGGVGNSANVDGNFTFADTGVNPFTASVPIPIGAIMSPGLYHPDNPLSIFSGADASGTWTLNIADIVTIDTGRLGSWTLSLETTTTPPGVPEPAAWSLMIGGFALAGMQLRRRSRQTVRFA